MKAATAVARVALESQHSLRGNSLVRKVRHEMKALSFFVVLCSFLMNGGIDASNVVGLGDCSGKSTTLTCTPVYYVILCSDLTQYASTEDPCDKHCFSTNEITDCSASQSLCTGSGYKPSCGKAACKPGICD